MTARGRGRGKPRDAEAAGRQAGAGPPRGPYAQMGGGAAAAPVPQQARAPATSAWGPSGGASARATHRPQAQPQLESQMQAMSLGAGRPVASEGPGRPAQTSGSGGNGNGGNGNGGGGPVGRGALRGRRQMETTVRVTKPAHISSKQGAIGKPIQLVANYFALKKHTNWVLRRYRVDISPDEDRTRERQNLLRVHRERLGGYLFDGTVLFTINSLTTPQNPTLTLTSQNREQTETYTLTVKEAGEVDYGDYAYVQVFNLLLRSCISALELSLVGRDYYDRRARIEVPRFRLELWPGYKTSIRQHEKEILMCVEITHKVMRMETALDILNDCYKRNRDDYRRDFVREVVGCIVLTKYNNKTYRVDDVAWDVHPRDNFLYRNEQVSFITYMQKKYDITIRDPAQPMLVSRAKARDIRAGMAEVIQLIPEVCYLTGLTDAMRNNFQLMRALAEYTKVAPDRRMDKLLDFNRRITTNEQAVAQMQRFQMKLEPDLVRIPGRTLPEENILLGAKNTVQAGGDVDWTKSLRTSPMLAPADLKNWVVLAPSKWRNDARAFVETLKRVSAGMQWRPREPELVDVENDNAAGYAQALTRVLDRGQPDLVLCAVPNNRGDRYSAIKKKCSVDRGVPSQVILCKNLNDPKKTMSIATKVAIQMNCKIGGAAWSVEIPLSGMMVVGFDVCHDTTDKSLSFGAMVASLDKQLTRYFSAVTPHRNGEELSNNLSINLVKALRKYSELNGSLPSRIIIYRDGVGEGQIPQVLDHELSSVLSRLTEVYGQPDAFKMTFIIVTKRINTRVFTDKRRNPPPGTVIDDVVTDPEKYDFFLVSQSVREGTVSPTSFNIIHDGVQLPPDRLQRLSYKLCHLYFNWSGTVRVPAPCQYAHKLAFLVGQALHREPSSQLEDLLHYL